MKLVFLSPTSQKASGTKSTSMLHASVMPTHASQFLKLTSPIKQVKAWSQNLVRFNHFAIDLRNFCTKESAQPIMGLKR